MEDKITIIKQRKGWVAVNFRELFRYRELLWTLALREIKVRYKQTAIGGLWAILQPLLTMIIFTVFFGKVAKIPSDGVPYAIFSYSGLLLWTYFANSVTLSSASMVYHEKMISKIYFPRLLIPASATLIGIIDYLIAFVIVFGMMFWYNFTASLYLFLIPCIFFFTWMLASGIGFWLSAINVKYRDVRYAVPFFIQLLIFLTPVIYPVSVAGKYKWLLMLNPMSGFVEAHRTMILGHQAIDWGMLGISIALTLVVFIGGIVYFKSTERYFADII